MSLTRKEDGASDPRSRVARPFRVLSFDPGGTTGWAQATWVPSSDEPLTELSQITFTEGHLGPDEHHEELWNFLQSEVVKTYPTVSKTGYVNLNVVCESFQFRQHINKDHAKTKVELISCEYIGIIKLFCSRFAIDLTMNTASSGKTFIPDKGPQANVKLQQLGLYTPSMKHANDAKRHLLRFLTINLRIREPITDKWLA